MRSVVITFLALTALAAPTVVLAQSQTTSQATQTSTPATPAQTQTAPSTTATRPPRHTKPQTYTPGSPETPAVEPGASRPQDATAAEFDHVALHVRDLAKSADFYQRVLGLVQIPDPFNDAQHVFMRLGAHSQLHLVTDAPDAAKAASATKSATATHDIHEHFALHVASVPDFAARLDRMKVAYRGARNESQKITKRPDGVNQLYFQDPDGYWIEINDAKNQ